MLGIIVMVSFVQDFIDKQDIQEESAEENKKIIRYEYAWAQNGKA